MSLIIEVENLFKAFGSVHALDGISFNVERGAICGLLGANGAGKTTTIAVLLGLLTPTSGSVRILGRDFLADRYAVLPHMNFSSPYVDLPQRLTVQENLDVYARLYGVNDRNSRIDRLYDALDLAEYRDRAYSTLSAGQKTRVALAKALVNQPELLLLDEPTASMDPDTADRIRHYLKDYRARSGATILFASHNMNEVERMCDQVLILHQGRIVDSGSPARMIAAHGRVTLEEVFLDVVRTPAAAARENPAPGQNL
ncbi:MAG: ABC transporter ATP-binding protein [Gammaproteobacteria bacterium]|nr:ABC transporter ATP-binding protein [Gammaproteobacteria bacterium]